MAQGGKSTYFQKPTTWVQTSEPSRSKKKTDPCRLFSDLHTCSGARASIHTDKDIQTNKCKKKCLKKINKCTWHITERDRSLGTGSSAGMNTLGRTLQIWIVVILLFFSKLLDFGLQLFCMNTCSAEDQTQDSCMLGKCPTTETKSLYRALVGLKLNYAVQDGLELNSNPSASTSWGLGSHAGDISRPSS